MKTGILCLAIVLSMALPLAAGDAVTGAGGSFNIRSRTTLGVDLDSPHRFGLKNELTQFSLVFNLFPYQQISNRVSADYAVGFVDITLFHLDLLVEKGLGYNAPDEITTNRFQTGIFTAGIAWDNWVLQLNAGANEPFWSPWNKGLEFINDKVKFSWAHLGSMVDVRRTNAISTLDPQDSIVAQFQQDASGLSDRLGLNLAGNTVALLYAGETIGFSTKFSTQYGYDSANITEENANGLALGVDTALRPAGLPGFSVHASLGGSVNYGPDQEADPIMAGLKIGYNLPLNPDISLEPYLGFDGGLSFPESGSPEYLEWEAAAGVTMHWPGRGGWYTDYLVDGEGRVFPGMSVGYKLYGTTAMESVADYEHNLKFTLFEERGDDGVFYGIGSELVVDFVDFASEESQLFGTLYLDYAVPGIAGTAGTLRPWLILAYDNLPGQGDARINDLKFDIGAKLEDLISNTTLGLTWNTGSLLSKPDNPVFGFLKLSAEVRF